MDAATQCALCQLALFYSRSALESVEILGLLSDATLDTQARIEAIVECLKLSTDSKEPVNIT
jgi:hypothetical protein